MDKKKTTNKILIRTEGEDFRKLKQLVVSQCGAKKVVKEAGVAALMMNNGTLLELYAEYATYPEYLFKNSNVVTIFKVNDIHHASDEAISLGFKSLTGIIQVCSTLSYCHLQLSNGTVVGLYQED